jgi:hypothetical protein
VTAVENANVLAKLEEELEGSASLTREEKDRLRNVLRSGSLIAEGTAAPVDATKAAARL